MWVRVLGRELTHMYECSDGPVWASMINLPPNSRCSGRDNNYFVPFCPHPTYSWFTSQGGSVEHSPRLMACQDNSGDAQTPSTYVSCPIRPVYAFRVNGASISPCSCTTLAAIWVQLRCWRTCAPRDGGQQASVNQDLCLASFCVWNGDAV